MAKTSIFNRVSIPCCRAVCGAASVKNVRISEVGHQTRVTFVLNEPLSLDLEEDPENRRISVRAPHGTTWGIKDATTTIGFVRGYKTLQANKDRPEFILDVLSGTDIDDYGLRRNSQGQPEFFMDLRRDVETDLVPTPMPVSKPVAPPTPVQQTSLDIPPEAAPEEVTPSKEQDAVDTPSEPPVVQP